MKILLLLFVIFVAGVNSIFELPSCGPSLRPDCNTNEEEAKKYVLSLNDDLMNDRANLGLIFWKYAMNVTDETGASFSNAFTAHNVRLKAISTELRQYTWNQFQDRELVRLATSYYLLGDDIDDALFQNKSEIAKKLKSGFNNARVCKFEESNNPNCKKEMKLHNDIYKVFEKSHNYDELLHYWKAFREATGSMRSDYIKLIELENRASVGKGFRNLAEKWQQPYGVYNLPEMLLNAYEKKFQIEGKSLSLQDLYFEVHSYVKGKLMEKYNNQRVNIRNNGTIPAHLLGGMYGTHWDNLIDLVNPFSNIKPINTTPALIEKKYKPRDFFNISQDFFVSMGFKPMTEKFWRYSMFEDPKDGRTVDCHPEAFDMKGENDFRVKRCGRVRHVDFLSAHQSMAFIAYAMLYRKQPYAYQDVANPAFHYAIEGLIRMAASLPSHLRNIGLLEPESNSQDFVDLTDGKRYKRNDISHLMSEALNKVVFLPYGLTMETWRMNFIKGNINENSLNSEYWKLRERIQGVEAPESRSEENLDPLANMFIINNVKNMRSIYGYILQYQIYEALCVRAEQYDPDNPDLKPLHHCDFSLGGPTATEPLRDMMKKGSSQNWTISMQTLVETAELSGEPMLKYYMPLYNYLKQENTRNNMRPWK